MLDVRYRNPAWVMNLVMDENSERAVWSARFRMATAQAVEEVKASLMEAGAIHVWTDAGSVDVAVVEFTPVLVRRIVAAAVARGGVLIELARGPSNRRVDSPQ